MARNATDSSDFDISIVVISFNTVDYTDECLQSVYDNLGQINAQIIVVDNASEDGSSEMVREKFPGAILIENTDNRGFSAANNQAFELCSGRLILLLNSDTIVLDDVLQKSIEYMDQHPDVGAFGCRVLNTDRTVQRTCSQFPSIFNQVLQTLGVDRLPYPRFFGRYQMRHWSRDSERDVDVISGCYLIVPKEILDTVGTLDEDFFFFGEETDWCRRIQNAGWKTRFSPVGEIIHHGSVSARKLNEKRDLLLGEAKVRLHKKYGGYSAAITVFFILLCFNFSRAVFWSLKSLINSNSKERAKHFRKVTLKNFTYWPSKL